LHHQVAADLTLVIAEAIFESLRRRQQEQPWGLDRVRRDHNEARPLAALDTVFEVTHAGGQAGALVDENCTDMRMRTDLGAVCQRVRHMRDQGRSLGVDFAALQAKSPVDAMRSIAETAVRDRDRAYPDRDRKLPASLDARIAVARHRLGLVWVTVRIAPW